jgi:hypothetical protein
MLAGRVAVIVVCASITGAAAAQPAAVPSAAQAGQAAPAPQQKASNSADQPTPAKSSGVQAAHSARTAGLLQPLVDAYRFFKRKFMTGTGPGDSCKDGTADTGCPTSGAPPGQSASRPTPQD